LDAAADSPRHSCDILLRGGIFGDESRVLAAKTLYALKLREREGAPCCSLDEGAANFSKSIKAD
jgi:hypothetical protein